MRLKHLQLFFYFSYLIKFLFSKKATKINEIFTIDLTLCSKCQIDGEDFVNFLWPSQKTRTLNKVFLRRRSFPGTRLKISLTKTLKIVWLQTCQSFFSRASNHYPIMHYVWLQTYSIDRKIFRNSFRVCLPNIATLLVQVFSYPS